MFLKSSPNFSVLTSADRFPTKLKTTTATETGKTTEENKFKIPSLKKTTAGRKTAADTVPPAAAMRLRLHCLHAGKDGGKHRDEAGKHRSAHREIGDEADYV